MTDRTDNIKLANHCLARIQQLRGIVDVLERVTVRFKVRVGVRAIAGTANDDPEVSECARSLVAIRNHSSSLLNECLAPMTVRMTRFPEGRRIATIKQVRKLFPGMEFETAKAFVEGTMALPMSPRVLGQLDNFESQQHDFEVL